MKKEITMGFDHYSCLFVQDERQAALIELNAMEKKHKELQVLSLVVPNISSLILLLMFNLVFFNFSCTRTHVPDVPCIYQCFYNILFTGGD